MSSQSERRQVFSGGRSYHHGNLRAALVEGALEMLEEGGSEEVSLRGLAARLGVSRSAPYAHFQDKDALLRGVAGAGFDRLAKDMSEGSGPDASPRDRFLASGRAYVAFALANPNLFRLMFSPPAKPRSAADERALLADGRSPYAVFAAALEAYLGASGMAARDPAVVRATAWSCVHGLAVLLLDGRVPAAPEERGAITDAVTRTFADMLEAQVKVAAG